MDPCERLFICLQFINYLAERHVEARLGSGANATVNWRSIKRGNRAFRWRIPPSFSCPVCGKELLESQEKTGQISKKVVLV